MDERLSWPWWLVTYRNKVPPSGVEPEHVTHPSTNRARRRVTSLIRSIMLYHYATPPPCMLDVCLFRFVLVFKRIFVFYRVKFRILYAYSISYLCFYTLGL